MGISIFLVFMTELWTCGTKARDHTEEPNEVAACKPSDGY
jgi:hypothetical protein